MKNVFNHLTKRSSEYAQSPVFVYLRDNNVDSKRRLEVVPWLSHFVMSFADLYNSFLIERPAADHYQELVNTHLSEESSHWKWFLTDLDTLGLNPSMTLADALRMLWGAETQKTRALAYEVCKLSSGLSSLEKLVMVHAIEATGRVALEALVPVGNELATRLGRKLIYFGQHHLDTERNHTVEEESVHSSLETIAIDAAQEERMYKIVDEIFAHFTAFANEAYQHTVQQRRFVPPSRGRESTVNA